MSTISLTIRIKGGKLLSENECHDSNSFIKHRIITERLVKKKEGKKIYKKIIKEAIDFKTRDTEDVYQTININSDAYNYWTSRNKQDKPAWMDVQTFKASNEVRIKAWCDTIAHDMGGVVDDFTVFPD